MRKSNQSIIQLKQVFKQKTILTMPEMKGIIGTNVNMTVYRILCKLPYISSYSHAGKYYTLNTIAEFDKLGLWEYDKVYFSRFGTLKNTIIKILNSSHIGYTANELTEILKIPVYNVVLNLYKERKLDREQVGNQYVYVAVSKGKAQLQKWKEEKIAYGSNYDAYLSLFLSSLNEKQRRWYAGLESLKIGYGGDKIISQRTGLDVKTVVKGRKELEFKEIDIERIRKFGAGRPSIKKNKR
jgi:hypothetical protein